MSTRDPLQPPFDQNYSVGMHMIQPSPIERLAKHATVPEQLAKHATVPERLAKHSPLPLKGWRKRGAVGGRERRLLTQDPPRRPAPRRVRFAIDEGRRTEDWAATETNLAGSEAPVAIRRHRILKDGDGVAAAVYGQRDSRQTRPLS